MGSGEEGEGGRLVILCKKALACLLSGNILYFSHEKYSKNA